SARKQMPRKTPYACWRRAGWGTIWLSGGIAPSAPTSAQEANMAEEEKATETAKETPETSTPETKIQAHHESAAAHNPSIIEHGEDLDAKTVVVTGVSTGIGYGVAQELIAQGYQVIGTVRK